MPDTPELHLTETHLERARDFVAGNGWPGHVDELAALIASVEADALRLAPGSNNPPEPIDPEKLIDPDALPPILAEKYAPLVKRSTDLLAAVERWKNLHTETPPGSTTPGFLGDKHVPRLRILDEADNQKTSDFMRQIAAFAGGVAAPSGAVNEQREKVKKPVLDSGKVIDAWFNALRDDLRTFSADVGRLQTTFLRDKAAAEQRKRDEEARQAEEAAQAALKNAIASDGDDHAVAEAVRTTEIAARAEMAAAAPRTEMARSTSTFGTTTSLRANWTFRVVSMMDLVKAVAEGKAPIDFLTTQDGVIRASIKAGRRECGGLEIYNDEKAVRTGRTT